MMLQEWKILAPFAWVGGFRVWEGTVEVIILTDKIAVYLSWVNGPASLGVGITHLYFPIL